MHREDSMLTDTSPHVTMEELVTVVVDKTKWKPLTTKIN